jgi:hypothetical protein
MIFESNFRFSFRQRSSIPQLISLDCCHGSRKPMLTPFFFGEISYAGACLPGAAREDACFFAALRRICDSNDMLADEETIRWPEVADSCGAVWPESRV